MSKHISNILSQPERLVRQTLDRLEDKNGYPSHDARHLAENIQQVRLKIAGLGLDPDDTTAQELYHALLVRFEKDSLAFDIENGFHSLEFEQKAAKAAEIIKNNTDLPQRWVLKPTAAKNLLRQHPPKKLMKQLSYRSMESMLKRENIGQLYIQANLTESAAWKKELARLVSKQDTTVFEIRSIAVTSLSDEEGSSPLIYNDDVGMLAINRTQATNNLRLLGLTVLLADFVNSLNGTKVAQQFGDKSSVIRWWSDMDGLISGLNSDYVSLNIKDVSLNHAGRHEFSERSLAAGRSSFWKNLLSRYENQLEIEEDKLSDLSYQIVTSKIPIRQPAFEYVEDF
jgi:hypothetical protein